MKVFSFFDSLSVWYRGRVRSDRPSKKILQDLEKVVIRILQHLEP